MHRFPALLSAALLAPYHGRTMRMSQPLLSAGRRAARRQRSSGRDDPAQAAVMPSPPPQDLLSGPRPTDVAGFVSLAATHHQLGQPRRAYLLYDEATQAGVSAAPVFAAVTRTLLNPNPNPNPDPNPHRSPLTFHPHPNPHPNPNPNPLPMQYEGAAEGASHLPRSILGQAGHHREAGAAHMARGRGRARPRARAEKQGAAPRAPRLTPYAPAPQVRQEILTTATLTTALLTMAP